MADKPAVTNQQILEGLWMIGVDPKAFAGADPNSPDFLRKLGVTSEFIDRAKAAVAWRASDNKGSTVMSQQVASLLRAGGYRPDEVKAFLDTANRSPNSVDDPKQLLATLTAQFGDRTAGAMMTKVTGGKAPDGAAWNPYRTDAPPPNANVTYGWGGSPGTAGEGTAGARVDQPGQLPIPPTPVQQKQKAAAAPPQGIPTAAKPTATPGAGAAGAGGKTNQLPTVFIPKSPQEINDFIHQHFGQDAWFMDQPEVAKILLDMASKGNTDGDEAIRQVSTTAWYKSLDKDARQWYSDERQDPGTTKEKIRQQTIYLQGLADKEGTTIDPQRLHDLAETSLRYNWKQSQIDASLKAEFKYDPTSTKQASQIGTMKGIAADYMVPLSDDALKTWDKGLSTGDFSTADYTEYVKSVAKSMFPQMATAIDAGHTVKNYIDPYRQMAAQTLDLAPDQIDFMNDPRFRSAIDQTDPKTGMRTVMTLSDFSTKMKTDSSYGYDKTTAGIGEGASLATNILQKFGKI